MADLDRRAWRSRVCVPCQHPCLHDAPEQATGEQTFVLGLLGGRAAGPDLSLVLLLTGASASPLGSIDLRSRPLFLAGKALGGGSVVVLRTLLPFRTRLTPGGTARDALSFTGVDVAVGREPKYMLDAPPGIKEEIKLGRGRRVCGRIEWSAKVVSPTAEGVLQSHISFTLPFHRQAMVTHSQVFAPSMPTRADGPAPASGVKKPALPPPPLISGLSCLRCGKKGISDAELRGMGLGESVGGRE